MGSHFARTPNTVPVWGCVSACDGTSVLKRLDGRLDTKQYKELLAEFVLPISSSRRPFVHDHFPVHHARAVIDWLNKNSITVMDCPKLSGDIMPLEEIWKNVVQELNAQTAIVSNTEQMWAELSEIWPSLCTNSYVNDLIDEIPRKLEMIIKNDGDWVRVSK